jgi:hypothetical protein
MPNNRFQQGGVYRRGKHKDTWYGTYRIDTPEGRQPVNLRLGTTRELVTKAAAREKQREMIVEMTNPGARHLDCQVDALLTSSGEVEAERRTSNERQHTEAL